MSNKTKTGPTLDSPAIQAHMFPASKLTISTNWQNPPQISIEEENNYRSDEMHT